MTGPDGRSHPVIGLLAGAVLISFAPILVKGTLADGIGPTAIGFWRTAFGALALLVPVLVRRRGLGLDGRAMLFAAVAGFIFCLDLFLWHRSIALTGAGMATILGNTQVFASAVLGLLLFRERPGRRSWLAAVAGLAGVALLVGVGSAAVDFSPDYVRGILDGLATGVAYAAFLIILKAARRQPSPPDLVTFVGWVAAYSALFLGMAALLEGAPLRPTAAEGWLKLATLGVTAQALGWWLITSSLARTATWRAGLILLLQPTLATLWGVLVFGERLTPVQVIGAVVTLGAIYFGGLRRQGPSRGPLAATR